MDTVLSQPVHDIRTLKPFVRVMPPSNYDGKPQREVETLWTLDREAHPLPDGVTAELSLTTRHQPESKIYRTTVTWHIRDIRQGYTVVTWCSDYAYGVLARTPVARFSRSSLLAEADAQRTYLLDNVSMVDHIVVDAVTRTFDR